MEHIKDRLIKERDEVIAKLKKDFEASEDKFTWTQNHCWYQAFMGEVEYNLIESERGDWALELIDEIAKEYKENIFELFTEYWFSAEQGDFSYEDFAANFNDFMKFLKERIIGEL